MTEGPDARDTRAELEAAQSELSRLRRALEAVPSPGAARDELTERLATLNAEREVLSGELRATRLVLVQRRRQLEKLEAELAEEEVQARGLADRLADPSGPTSSRIGRDRRWNGDTDDVFLPYLFDKGVALADRLVRWWRKKRNR